MEYQTFLNFLNSFEHFVTVYRCNPSSRRYIPVGQFDLVSVDGKLVTAGLPPNLQFQLIVPSAENDAPLYLASTATLETLVFF